MTDWIKKRFDKITLNWTNLLIFGKRSNGTKILSKSTNDNMVIMEHNKRSQRYQHNRSDRDANQDFMKYCDRVYVKQNNCAWRCVQQQQSTDCPNVRKCQHKTRKKKQPMHSNKCNVHLKNIKRLVAFLLTLNIMTQFQIRLISMNSNSFVCVLCEFYSISN